MAPHATSTKNGSPSATCATTFWAACEASGEMTEAAMRAVVAMAVCFFLFNDNNSERGTVVSYAYISLKRLLSLSLSVRERVSQSLSHEKGEREKIIKKIKKNYPLPEKSARARSPKHTRRTQRERHFGSRSNTFRATR